MLHNWPQLPDKFTWQITHNLAFDRAGNLYVIHEGDDQQAGPSGDFCFRSRRASTSARSASSSRAAGTGWKFTRKAARSFSTSPRYQHLKNFSKLTLTGEPVWERHAPMESGIYAAGEDTHPTATWGRDRFMPTNIAFHPTAATSTWPTATAAMRFIGTTRTPITSRPSARNGNEDGQFNLPHGVWVDNRPADEPSVVVADRVNDRLQWFTLDGKHLETLDGFILPANVDTYGEVMLVPDLKSRVTLLDGQE